MRGGEGDGDEEVDRGRRWDDEVRAQRSTMGATETSYTETSERDVNPHVIEAQKAEREGTCARLDSVVRDKRSQSFYVV